jgi:D-3-phosphoglycerate dehydrogenase
VGVDSIDVVSAERRGVVVERAVGSNARAVAELALAQVLNGLRGIVPASRALADGAWEPSQGRELPDSTVGVVGLGAVGGVFATMVTALGADVIATDPRVHPRRFARAALRRGTLEDVLVTSHAVSLHCPVPADRHPVVGRDELALVAPGTVLVNTARSVLVDEEAVLAALDSGRLSAYAVDAFDREPPTIGPLLAHPKVIATPHLGGLTAASRRRMAEAAVANIVKHLEPS